MSDPQTCPQCSSPLPPDAPHGVCPRCVLGLGLSGASAAQPTAPLQGRFDLPHSDDLARLFPNLEIIGLVGHGGMGAVYKARQPGLDRMVALKILPPEVGRDPTFAERFAREARALARLSHNNIVAVYDSGQTGGLYYFIMEFIDGVNLRQALVADQITPEKALAIVPQICDALQYAHEEGIIHRDIKPENVLLDKKGRVKVADFGLAKLVGNTPHDITLTGTSQAMGTLHYMAPEQMEQPQSVDHRADIYSLGVVFYELLTGRLPLGRFALPSERVNIDIRLDEIVLRTLEREPGLRYQRVSDVKTDMDLIARPMENSPARNPARSEPAPRPASQPASTPAASRAGIPTALVIALVALPVAVLAMLCLGGPLLMVVLGITNWSVGSIAVALGLLLVLTATIVAVGAVISVRTGRKESDPPQALLPEQYQEARRQVRWPAFAMLVVGLVNCVPIVALLADDDAVLFDMPFGLRIVGTILSVALSAAIIFGALCMRDLRFYALAVVASVLVLAPFHFACLIGIPVGVWALTILMRKDVQAAFQVAAGRLPLAAQLKGESPVVVRPAPSTMLLAAVCALLPCLLAAGLMQYAYWQSKSYARAFHPESQWNSDKMKSTDKMESTTVPPKPMGHEPKAAILWAQGLPKTGPRLIEVGISPAKIGELDKALADIYRDYQAVEKKHITRKINELGHTLVTIGAFPKELSRLEDRFWTAADAAVTDNSQRGILRNELKLEGIFRYGQAENSIELWKSGAWYYGQTQYNKFTLGPELPPNYQGLLEPEPMADGKH